MNAVQNTTAWRRWLPLWLLWVVVVIAYFDTARGMVEIWSRSDTFAHGFLVPPIVAWLIWRRRALLAAISTRPQWGMLLPLAIAALAWLIGDLASSNAVTQFAFTSMLVLAVPLVMGLPFTRALLFPLGFLYFAVPFGEFLMPKLMDWTADFTVSALSMSGIPVFREGLQFVIPSGNWSVVEACSGVRYLIASVMVGTLFAHLNYRSLQRRLLFVAVSVVVPVIANWFRAYMIVMLGHLSDNKLAAGVDHLIYGWVFFGIVIGLMFLIGGRWADTTDDDLRPAGRVAPAAPFAMPRTALATALAGALLLTVPHAVSWNITRLELAAGSTELTLPKTLANGWSEQANGSIGWKPAFEGPTAEINRAYASGNDRVGLYVGYYRKQDYRNKLVTPQNSLVKSNDPHWAQVAKHSQLASFGSEQVAIRTASLRSHGSLGAQGESRMLAWQVYWVNGTLTSSDAWARLLGAAYKMAGRGDDAAVIVVYTSETPDQRAAERLQSFVAANHTILDQQLRTARDRKIEVAQPGGLVQSPRL